MFNKFESDLASQDLLLSMSCTLSSGRNPSDLTLSVVTWAQRWVLFYWAKRWRMCQSGINVASCCTPEWAEDSSPLYVWDLSPCDQTRSQGPLIVRNSLGWPLTDVKFQSKGGETQVVLWGVTEWQSFLHSNAVIINIFDADMLLHYVFPFKTYAAHLQLLLELYW